MPSTELNAMSQSSIKVEGEVVITCPASQERLRGSECFQEGRSGDLKGLIIILEFTSLLASMLVVHTKAVSSSSREDKH